MRTWLKCQDDDVSGIDSEGSEVERFGVEFHMNSTLRSLDMIKIDVDLVDTYLSFWREVSSYNLDIVKSKTQISGKHTPVENE